jgi:peptidoglycan-associated lipoprotein
MLKPVILPLLGVFLIASVLATGCALVSSGHSDYDPMTGVPARSVSASGEDSLEALRYGRVASSEGPLKNVFFDFDRHDLGPDARETLEANAKWLKANPSKRVQIEGHADERGTNEYNLALGFKRAQSCKDYLISLGIAAQRLTTISYGEELPVCREKTEECWQKNRRGHFVAMVPQPTS